MLLHHRFNETNNMNTAGTLETYRVANTRLELGNFSGYILLYQCPLIIIDFICVEEILRITRSLHSGLEVQHPGSSSSLIITIFDRKSICAFARIRFNGTLIILLIRFLLRHYSLRRQIPCREQQLKI